ncbi:MAG: hypothetical protein Q9204_005478 [Flavoplaca sp. TL-2023a]
MKRTEKAVYAASYQAMLKNSVSPTELAAIERGTYEEVEKELIATARETARQLRQKQKLQQLERLPRDHQAPSLAPNRNRGAGLRASRTNRAPRMRYDSSVSRPALLCV